MSLSLSSFSLLTLRVCGKALSDPIKPDKPQMGNRAYVRFDPIFWVQNRMNRISLDAFDRFIKFPYFAWKKIHVIHSLIQKTQGFGFKRQVGRSTERAKLASAISVNLQQLGQCLVGGFHRSWRYPKSSKNKAFECYPLVNIQKTDGKSPCLMRNVTISRAMFNSYVKLPECKTHLLWNLQLMLVMNSWDNCWLLNWWLLRWPNPISKDSYGDVRDLPWKTISAIFFQHG